MYNSGILLCLLLIVNGVFCTINTMDSTFDCSGVDSAYINTINYNVEIVCGNPKYVPGAYILAMELRKNSDAYKCDVGGDETMFYALRSNSTFSFSNNIVSLVYNSYDESSSTITENVSASLACVKA